MAKKLMSLLVVMTMMISLVSGVAFATEVNTTVDAVKELEGGTHVLAEDITANGCDGAIYAHSGANVTINGGNVHGVVCKGEKCDGKYINFAMALGAWDAGTTITITNGKFTQDPIEGDVSPLIYASAGAKILITGGEFQGTSPEWTLNCNDNSGSTITVTGGKFYKFNPAIANFDPAYGDSNSNTGVAPAGGSAEVVVPEGYKVVQEGDWYSVVVDEEYQLRNTFTNGGSYKLTTDIDLKNGGLTVPVGKTVSLDLNGHTLSMTDSSKKGTALITNSGTLNITSSTGSGLITFVSTTPDLAYGYATNTITNGGMLTVEKVTVKNTTGKGASYAIDNNSTSRDTKTTLNNNATIVSDYVAIRLFANSTTAKNDLVVNSASITGTRGIQVHLPGSKQQDKLASVEINDGTITSLGESGGYRLAIYSMSNGDNYNNTSIKINGGTFDGDVVFGGGSSRGGLGAENVVITNGNFGDVYSYMADDRANITISGGKFDVEPVEAYLAENRKWDSVTHLVGCAHESKSGYPLKEATYVEEGCQPYYECNDCHKLFMDAAATTEVASKADLVIPKLIEIKGTEAVVSDAAVMGAIQKAEDSSVVELPVLEASSTVKEVTVPVASVEAVAEQDKGLLIETSDVTVTLDAKTVATVAEEAKDATKITIEVTKEETKILNTAQKEAVKDKKVEVVISAKILADGKEISDFKGGKVTVEIPFKPAEGLKVSDYKFVYIDDNGKVTEIPTKYFDGVMVVELEHFSEYAIVREEKKETTSGETTSTPAPAPAPAAPVKDNTPKTGAISVIGLVSAMAVGGLVITRKRK